MPLPKDFQGTRTERIIAHIYAVQVQIMDYGKVEGGTPHSRDLIEAMKLLREQVEEEKAAPRS